MRKADQAIAEYRALRVARIVCLFCGESKELSSFSYFRGRLHSAVCHSCRYRWDQIRLGGRLRERQEGSL